MKKGAKVIVLNPVTHVDPCYHKYDILEFCGYAEYNKRDLFSFFNKDVVCDLWGDEFKEIPKELENEPEEVIKLYFAL